MEEYLQKDKISSFDVLKSDIDSKTFLKYYGLTVVHRENEIVLIKLSELCQVEYSILINNSMKCVLRKEGVVISPGYSLWFDKIVNQWSTIEKVIPFYY